MRPAPGGAPRLSRPATALVGAMVLTDAALAAYFWSQTGWRTYLAITAALSAGATAFVYLMLRRGVVYARGRRIARDEDRTTFRRSVIVTSILYALILAFSVGLFTQERDRLASPPPSRTSVRSR